MSINIESWKTSYQAFEEQVRQFNQKIETSHIEEAELKEIYKIVKQEVGRLQEFTKTAKQRENEFGNTATCSPSGKAIWTVTSLNVASKACAIAGALLAILSKSSTTTWAGLGIFAVGETLDVASSGWDTKLNLQGIEIAELSKLNQAGVEHAQIFKNFLKELKKVKKIQKKIIQENQTNEARLDLDQQISSCLHYYEELPNCYRRDDLYCRIISILIQQLPNNDPLKQALNSFEPNSYDISTVANQPLPYQYFQFSRRSRPNLLSQSASIDEDKWTNEQASKPIEESLSTEETDLIESKKEYIKQVACYKQSVTQRFNIKRAISSFYTCNGWCVSAEEGIRHTQLSNKQIPENQDPLSSKEFIFIDIPSASDSGKTESLEERSQSLFKESISLNKAKPVQTNEPSSEHIIEIHELQPSISKDLPSIQNSESTLEQEQIQHLSSESYEQK